jgi:hypothetical protein
MKTYEIVITATARATVTVRAPDKSSALEFLKENFDGYGLDYEIDEMCAEVDAGIADIQRNGVIVVDDVWGVTEADDQSGVETDYTVDTEWLEENGYEVITTIRKRENV